MKRYGIEVDVKNVPKLDPGFMPILKFNQAFLQTAQKPVSIAVERSGGQVAAPLAKKALQKALELGF